MYFTCATISDVHILPQRKFKLILQNDNMYLFISISSIKAGNSRMPIEQYARAIWETEYRIWTRPPTILGFDQLGQGSRLVTRLNVVSMANS